MTLREFKEKILENLSKTDWETHGSRINEYYDVATLKEDLSISLRKRSDYVLEEFVEPWANNWPDPRASSSLIDFCFNGEVIFTKLVVSIDGARGLILYPSRNFENVARKYTRENYKIAKLIEKLFSGEIGKVDEVIAREEWLIED